MRPGLGVRGAGFGALTAALVLGALATGACSKPRQDPLEQVQQADSADQILFGLKLYLTNNGVRQAYLNADTAFYYESTGRQILKKVHVTFFSPTGDSTSVLTSRQGFYWTRTNIMEAVGDVVVVRKDGARLTTSELWYDQAKNEVHTDSAYVFNSTDKHGSGSGFTSDPTFTNIQSRGVRGTAGHFTLPGQ